MKILYKRKKKIENTSDLNSMIQNKLFLKTAFSIYFNNLRALLLKHKHHVNSSMLHHDVPEFRASHAQEPVAFCVTLSFPGDSKERCKVKLGIKIHPG